VNRVLIFAPGRGAGLFDPLDQTRPPCRLRNGVWSIAERWIKLLEPTAIVAAVHPSHQAVIKEQTGWSVNGIDDDFARDVWIIEGTASPVRYDDWQENETPNRFHWTDGHTAVTRLAESDWRDALEDISRWIADGGTRECPGEMPPAVTDESVPIRGASGLWSLINHLSEQLDFDSSLWWDSVKVESLDAIECHRGAVLIEETNIAVSPGVRIGPGCVVDASSGPVILDAEVVLEPFTHLKGPAYIGRGTRLLGGKITGPCAFGPGCKLAGEIEASIVQGFANKAHAGFFGHGILGEWVNLGAMTTNSDLKNTYGSVRVVRSGETVDTGCTKVGSYLADHTKTGIGTLLPTGATFGTGVNILSGGLTAKWIPPFVWVGADNYAEHRLEPMLATAQMVVKRRAAARTALGLAEEMTEAEIQALRDCFEESADSRREFFEAAEAVFQPSSAQ
jgi:UDP-N-acetylglucosamine diphosphorylase/glucosamine-1-phosphate N-acetyltransferase